MPLSWRDKYAEPSINSGGCWVLPSDPEILQDYRSFGGCILTFVSALTNYAGWQRVFLAQLFERILSDDEFGSAFWRLHRAGLYADTMMHRIMDFSQAVEVCEVVEPIKQIDSQIYEQRN
jgi:hypothetical protein